MPGPYITQTSVSLRLSVKVDGVLTTPTTLSLRLRNPSGEETMYTYPDDIDLEGDDAGKFVVVVTADVAGKYYYKWIGTGAGAGASEGSFSVSQGSFT